MEANSEKIVRHVREALTDEYVVEEEIQPSVLEATLESKKLSREIGLLAISLGVEPEQVAETLGLSIHTIKGWINDTQYDPIPVVAARISEKVALVYSAWGLMSVGMMVLAKRMPEADIKEAILAMEFLAKRIEIWGEKASAAGSHKGDVVRITETLQKIFEYERRTQQVEASTGEVVVCVGSPESVGSSSDAN